EQVAVDLDRSAALQPEDVRQARRPAGGAQEAIEDHLQRPPCRVVATGANDSRRILPNRLLAPLRRGDGPLTSRSLRQSSSPSSIAAFLASSLSTTIFFGRPPRPDSASD